MFLSKTLHTELLKAAEQNGVNKMLTWGGVGAGVGGAYGMFSDTGTTMEGAFKGAILGGGAAVNPSRPLFRRDQWTQSKRANQASW